MGSFFKPQTISGGGSGTLTLLADSGAPTSDANGLYYVDALIPANSLSDTSGIITAQLQIDVTGLFSVGKFITVAASISPAGGPYADTIVVANGASDDGNNYVFDVLMTVRADSTAPKGAVYGLLGGLSISGSPAAPAVFTDPTDWDQSVSADWTVDQTFRVFLCVYSTVAPYINAQNPTAFITSVNSYSSRAWLST